MEKRKSIEVASCFLLELKRNRLSTKLINDNSVAA